MNRITKTFTAIIFILAMVSCIKNDIPFPYIPASIEDIEVQHQEGKAKIDASKGTVTLDVNEDAELENIVITKLIVTEEAKIYPDSTKCQNFKKFPDFSFTSLNDLPGNANTAIDFTNPVRFLLKTYQNYIWTVSVNQIINRVISVENQVGEPLIDVKNKIVIIYVDNTQSLKDITIKELKLEGSKTILSPDPQLVKDFSRPQIFKAFRGRKYMGEWTVDILNTETLSSTGETDAWAKKAFVTGAMKQGCDFNIEYKKESDNEWNIVPKSDVDITSATTFTAEIKGLEPATNYQWRIVVNGTAGKEATFTTETIVEIPNLDFETWVKSGKNWYPNTEAKDDIDDPNTYWATGNEGVTLFKESNSIPVEGAEARTGKAAKLTTVGSIPIAKAAAGNIFIGGFKTNTTNPVSSVTFGRPYNGARPISLTGYYKYESKAITSGNFPGNLTTDEGHIYIRLWDSNNTEIGYGELVIKESAKTYTQFNIEVKYTVPKTKPAKITIVATSSRYGGEFKGAAVVGQVGAGSTLWVDDFELLYE